MYTLMEGRDDDAAAINTMWMACNKANNPPPSLPPSLPPSPPSILPYLLVKGLYPAQSLGACHFLASM